MAASNGVSVVLSLSISLAIVAGMQIYKNSLASTQLMTIFGGFLSSWVFLFLLTALSNFEMSIFGKNFQSKLFEVIFCMVLSCLVAGLVHRVSITTCILFSLLALHFMNKISSREHQTSSAAFNVPSNPLPAKKRR